MPLVNKPVSDSQLSYIACFCCLPCRVVAACACLVFCEVREAAGYACGPCLDDNEHEDNAARIASTVLSCRATEIPHEKLLILTTEEWEAVSIFRQWLSALHLKLHTQIKDEVLKILNSYNFGAINSENLTEKEINHIGTQLKEAVMQQLPLKGDFEQEMLTNEINSSDVNALNGLLAGIISKIITEDFIYTQLDRISTEIELKRNGNALVNAQANLSMFRGVQAGTKANLSNDATLLIQPPPPTYS